MILHASSSFLKPISWHPPTSHRSLPARSASSTMPSHHRGGGLCRSAADNYRRQPNDMPCARKSGQQSLPTGNQLLTSHDLRLAAEKRCVIDADFGREQRKKLGPPPRIHVHSQGAKNAHKCRSVRPLSLQNRAMNGRNTLTFPNGCHVLKEFSGPGQRGPVPRQAMRCGCVRREWGLSRPLPSKPWILYRQSFP